MRRPGGIIAALVVIWLLIGLVAAWKRDYFTNKAPDCGVAVSIALNMLAGPLNWFGLDPHVGQCKVPEVPPPSNSMPSIVSVH